MNFKTNRLEDKKKERNIAHFALANDLYIKDLYPRQVILQHRKLNSYLRAL